MAHQYVLQMNINEHCKLDHSLPEVCFVLPLGAFPRSLDICNRRPGWHRLQSRHRRIRLLRLWMHPKYGIAPYPSSYAGTRGVHFHLLCLAWAYNRGICGWGSGTPGRRRGGRGVAPSRSQEAREIR